MARLAYALVTIGFDRTADGSRESDLATVWTAKDKALDLADPKFSHQLQIVVSLDALRSGIHAEVFGQSDDRSDDRRVAGRVARADAARLARPARLP